MQKNRDPEQIALDRIKAEADARTGTLDLGGLGLTRLPGAMFGLTHLRRLNLGPLPLRRDGTPNPNAKYIENQTGSEFYQISALINIATICIANVGCNDLSPLAGMKSLKNLDCGGNRSLRDLSPISRLTELTSLNCTSTDVVNLAPLANLPKFSNLNCSHTEIRNLNPLANLSHLTSLDCFHTSVQDLTPLAGLKSLHTLICPWTPISDLGPLANLRTLEQINCSRTLVSDLAPLRKLTRLKFLDCSVGTVNDLKPLSNLRALIALIFNRTDVSDLGPLLNLGALLLLDCSGTSVTDISPLTSLPRLSAFHCSDLNLKIGQGEVLQKLPSHELIAFQTKIPGIPTDVLSQSYNDNCLPSLRAHLDNVAAGAEIVRDTKLLILGNGRTGKTQLTRRLQRDPATKPFQTAWNSTHGIQIETATLPAAGDTPATPLRIWDFGGQDLYHGTHALFARGDAVFLILWAKDTNDARDYQHDGIRFRDHPLPYWCDYVRHLRDGAGPVLVVQNKCDKAGDGLPRAPVPEATLHALGSYRELQYSAATDRRREELDAALRGAVADRWERTGEIRVGKARLAVRRRLERMSGEDGVRSIAVADFDHIYEAEGAIGEPGLFLRNLHNAGVLFHDPDLFKGQIVLDQQWALDAIYAVLEPQKSYRQLCAREGRFLRQDLADWIWDDLGYEVEEQCLVLSMMEQCGICFALRRKPDPDATEYLAPDMLPERARVQTRLDAVWGEAPPGAAATFRFDFLHHGLMRWLTARIGRQAGMEAIYWRGGVQAFEATTRSLVRIEQTLPPEGWSGTISVETKGQRAEILRDTVSAWIAAESGKHGLTPVMDPPPRAVDRGRDAPAMDFRPARQSRMEYCVSYAWNDRSPGGPDREKIVDDFCAEAESRGIHIVRDKTDMGPGDRISTFMERIEAADRVVVILSDKYLKSEYCMTELYWIWESCRRRTRDTDFLSRIRVFAHDDAQFSSIEDRLALAEHWHDRLAALEARIAKLGVTILGPGDHDRLRLMQRFRDHVSPMLETVADTLHARNFDDLRTYGFGDRM